MLEVLEIVECSSSSLNTIFYITKMILSLIQIVGPLLLIISAIIKFTKLTINPEEKNGIKKIVNSFLAAAILFFIPLFINVVMNMLGNNYAFSSCWKDAKKPSYKVSYIPISEEKKKNINGDSSKYEKGKKKTLTAGDGEVIEGTAKQVGDVVWDSSDVTRISNLTSAQLIKILNSYGGNATNFVPYATGLITAEQKYQVNVFFLLGVEALESGWVTSSISRNCNNLGGVCESSNHPSNGCGSNSNCSFAYFPSVNQFVDYHAEMLHTNYLTPGGSFYHGKTPSAVVTDYCPGCSEWPGTVIEIADELFAEVSKVL